MKKTAFNKTEIRKHIGSMEQLCGIRSFVFDEGRAKGVKAFEIDNGYGMRFLVFPDRGLDIGQAFFDGRNVTHCTKTGIADSRFYEPAGDGWLRTFQGGLLTTCGLYMIGDPAKGDEGLGLHGRLANTPAFDVGHSSDWTNDGEYIMQICGKVRDAVFYGENLLIERKIAVTAGVSEITIRDVIRNEGFVPEKVMLLYHMNLGYPLIREGTKLEGSFTEITPLNDAAAKEKTDPNLYLAPDPEGLSLLYWRKVAEDEQGFSTIYLVGMDQTLCISYSSRTLPYLTQWKNNRAQDYVGGIEMGTGLPQGRTMNLKEGRYHLLKPGESFSTEIVISSF